MTNMDCSCKEFRLQQVRNNEVKELAQEKVDDYIDEEKRLETDKTIIEVIDICLSSAHAEGICPGCAQGDTDIVIDKVCHGGKPSMLMTVKLDIAKKFYEHLKKMVEIESQR